jgi:hypothetical protein
MSKNLNSKLEKKEFYLRSVEAWSRGIARYDGTRTVWGEAYELHDLC